MLVVLGCAARPVRDLFRQMSGTRNTEPWTPHELHRLIVEMLGGGVEGGGVERAKPNPNNMYRAGNHLQAS